MSQYFPNRTPTPEKDKINLGKYDFLKELFTMNSKKLEKCKWFIREISIQEQKLLIEKLKTAKNIFSSTTEKLQKKISSISNENDPQQKLYKQLIQGANRNIQENLKNYFLLIPLNYFNNGDVIIFVN